MFWPFPVLFQVNVSDVIAAFKSRIVAATAVPATVLTYAGVPERLFVPVPSLALSVASEPNEPAFVVPVIDIVAEELLLVPI